MNEIVAYNLRVGADEAAVGSFGFTTMPKLLSARTSQKGGLSKWYENEKRAMRPAARPRIGG